MTSPSPKENKNNNS